MAIINGTLGNDTLNGTPFDDMINAIHGNDILFGLAGNDKLDGDTGTDVLFGGDGNDDLSGGDGNDALNGGNGIDTASYAVAGGGVTVNLSLPSSQNTVGAGIDSLLNIENLTGSHHNDFLIGNGSNNVLLGMGGNDRLYGRAGNDLLNGMLGADTMDGGEGNDTYIVDDVLDVAVESLNNAVGGVDTVQSSAHYYTLGFGIEHLTLTGVQSFRGTGNDNNNVITGTRSSRDLSGQNGNDQIFCVDGAGTQILNGGLGNDLLNGGDGSDTADYSNRVNFGEPTFIIGATAGVTVNLNLQGVAQNTGGGRDRYACEY